MPYTLAHPLFAAPLRLLGLPLSALTAGAMVPDLPLWGTSVGLPVPAANAGYAFTHSIPGILTADLLIGVVMWWLWTALLRAPLLDALPMPVRDRFLPVGTLRVPAGSDTPGARRVAVASIAVVLGAVTHVGLDEFTHPGRWGAQHLPWLSQVHAGLPGTSWLQYGTGAVGLVGLVLWASWIAVRSAPRRTPMPSIAARRAVQLLVLAGAVAATVDVAVVALDSLHRAAFVAATRGVLTVLAGLTIGSVAWTVVIRRGDAHRSPAPVRPPGASSRPRFE